MRKWLLSQIQWESMRIHFQRTFRLPEGWCYLLGRGTSPPWNFKLLSMFLQGWSSTPKFECLERSTFCCCVINTSYVHSAVCFIWGPFSCCWSASRGHSQKELPLWDIQWQGAWTIFLNSIWVLAMGEGAEVEGFQLALWCFTATMANTPIEVIANLWNLEYGDDVQFT